MAVDQTTTLPEEDVPVSKHESLSLDSTLMASVLAYQDHMKEAGFSVTARLEFGPPRQTICKMANNEEFQLMIIGRRESTGEIRDVLFGSVANYVLHNVACPVLLF